MKDLSISLSHHLQGLAELEQHGSSGVTHVLSILDPDRADPDDFAGYDRHHRTTLRFHDIIQPMGEMILPEPKDVEAVLKFGEELTEQGPADDAHVLVHCHIGRVAFYRGDDDAALPVAPASRRGRSVCPPALDPAADLAQFAHDRFLPMPRSARTAG